MRTIGIDSSVSFDVVVVGAGPAGLAAALAVSANSKKSVLVLDAGPAISQRKPAGAGYTSGVGGAGLFSDGKLCLSLDVGGHLRATLVQSERKRLLEAVWGLFAGALDLSPGTSIEDAARQDELPGGCGVALDYKYYPVVHIGTERCADVVAHLVDAIEMHGAKVVAEHRVDVIERAATGWELQVSRLRDPTAPRLRLFAREVVLALGKVGAAQQAAWSCQAGAPLSSVPMYVGVRVETDAEGVKPLFRTRDPKYSRNFPDGSKIKTHCATLGGRVVRLEYEGLPLVGAENHHVTETDRGGFALLWDGVRDGHGYASAKTLMGRVAKQTGGRILAQTVPDWLSGVASSRKELEVLPLTVPHMDYDAGNIRGLFGSTYDACLSVFLEQLGGTAKALLGSRSVLFAPAIEWWMDRVEVDASTMRAAPGLYSCGDGAGWSQGIVHSAATGLLAAEAIIGRKISHFDLRQAFAAAPPRGAALKSDAFR